MSAQAIEIKRLEKENAELRRAITEMDAFSQSGCSEIAAVAKLALKWIETADDIPYRHSEVIKQALNVVCYKADDTGNLINCEAENVGCLYNPHGRGMANTDQPANAEV